MVGVFQYSTLVEILKVGMVNRKLYIKSGDVKMLRTNFMRRNLGINEGLSVYENK